MSGMAYDVEITGDQAAALAAWAEAGGLHIAPVQLAVDETGYLHAAQGDERAVFGEAGDRVDEEREDEDAPLCGCGGRHWSCLGPDAVDEDGVPIFSEETRAAATCPDCGNASGRDCHCAGYVPAMSPRPTDDPRYERGAH